MHISITDPLGYLHKYQTHLADGDTVVENL